MKWEFSPIVLAFMSLLLLTGCATAVRPDLPVPLELAMAASERLNPAEGGRPSPVVLRIFELSGTGFFRSADFFALLGLRDALPAEEVIEVQEFVLMPGEVRVIRRKADLATRHLGVAAGYRDVEGSAWRAQVALKPPHQAGRLWSEGLSPEQRFRIVIGERAVTIHEVDSRAAGLPERFINGVSDLLESGVK